MPRHAQALSIGARLTRRGPLRVPQVTALFWVIKGLSTAFGEATSDFLVHTIAPVVAVVFGFGAFVFALVLQFRRGRYSPWTYWFAVAMVGTFGTMAADVLHVALGVPYAASTVLYAGLLVAVFATWQRVEGTLSIHSIDTPRREAFYWAAVVATFAMGTALGDLTANTIGLGYFPSAVLFACIIAIPAFGFRFLGWSGIFSFWFAYVVTRPLGASVADGLGKPTDVSGLGIGAGWVALIFAAAIVVLVAYLAATGADQQPARSVAETPAEARVVARYRQPTDYQR